MGAPQAIESPPQCFLPPDQELYGSSPGQLSSQRDEHIPFLQMTSRKSTHLRTLQSRYRTSPKPMSHQQPVRWTHDRVVVCDGGGGPLGHPRIFINTDKPQICMCEYCGLPFANEHHRKHLESLPSTTYPLAPQGNAAEIPESQRITNEALGQR